MGVASDYNTLKLTIFYQMLILGKGLAKTRRSGVCYSLLWEKGVTTSRLPVATKEMS